MLKGNDIISVGVPIPTIVDVEYLGGHRLLLQFTDGTEGEVDLAEDVKHFPYNSLANPRQFIQFGLTHGTLVWSDELDISPIYLYNRVKQSHAT